ncbi:MAG: cytochrome c [Planctomycetales bacterium]
MNVRGLPFIALGILLPALLAGCGRPEAQFVFSKQMDQLPADARQGMNDTSSGQPVRIKGLEELLVESFGTPNRIVVWDKLPVDFGKSTWEVSSGWPAVVGESRELEDGKNEFEIRVRDASELPDDPRDTFIHWQAGPFAGALVQGKTGGDPRPAEFRVVGHDDGWLRVRAENFDASADRLVLNTGAVEVEEAFPAPPPAAAFLLESPPRAIGGDVLEVAVNSAGPEAEDLPDDPAGLAVEWLGGIYAGSHLEMLKGGEMAPARFRVAGYDRDTKRLRLQLGEFDPDRQSIVMNIPKAAEGESKGLPAPEPGVKFALWGNRLQEGKQLYAVHCMHCHGVSGDGNGPTAEYLDPLPRDYRHGIFKFTSTRSSERARRDDLRRTVLQGIPGTNMPSFLLLEEGELDAIIEYVLFLAMRGEVERLQIKDIVTRGIKKADFDPNDQAKLQELADYLRDEVPQEFELNAEIATEEWTRSGEEVSLVVPGKPRTPDSLESRQRGRALFLSAKAKCTDCHGVEGLGNGPQTEDFEDDPATGKKFDEPGLHDEWGHIVQPRNLTRGMYRGGRRPIDIYRRVYSGIKGAKMPAFGGTALNDDEIWDVVNYVLNIPYEQSGGGPVHEPRRESVAATAR